VVLGVGGWWVVGGGEGGGGGGGGTCCSWLLFINKETRGLEVQVVLELGI